MSIEKCMGVKIMNKQFFCEKLFKNVYFNAKLFGWINISTTSFVPILLFLSIQNTSIVTMKTVKAL